MSHEPADAAPDALAASIQDHFDAHADALPPGKFGAPLPAGLGLPAAQAAAKFVQSILADSLGPAAHALVAAEHDAIAAWVSPKLADLADELVAEFGSGSGNR